MANALIDETSPYLLQHAHNPVDWMPWGEAAFAKAREEGKLVFLSVGYSTCHWCHVMEHESFENESVARVMNEHFINVKVDREERPDVDSTFMAFVQATTGQGGWPMSVWLTPEGKPVAGGTYFPPEDKHGRPGFARICQELARVWRDDRVKVEASAMKVLEHLRHEARGQRVVSGMPDPMVFGDFVDACESRFDGEWAGFGSAPKFPRPAVPRTLLQLRDRFGADHEVGVHAWTMVEMTLRAMAAGGMHDQLGGGFHRYSVDRYWHIPHYEKMLYDQGQLALLYIEAWQVSQEPLFREVAEEIFRYVIGEMRDSCGAFHAAEDADSAPAVGEEKREGAYWVWTADEVMRVLSEAFPGGPEALLFATAYGVEAEGNAQPESDPHGELEGTNTLYRAMPLEQLAETFGLEVSDVEDRLQRARIVMRDVRAKRPLPHRDDKIVTAWNGLMIAALARGARVCRREDWAESAQAAARWIKANLWDGDELERSYRGKSSGVAAFPADYACLVAGLLELHALDGRQEWIDWACELQSALDAKYWDAERMGYVVAASVAGESLLPVRDDYDGAEPAAGHVVANNLFKLAVLVERPAYATRAEAILRGGAHALKAMPFAAPVLVDAFDLWERGVTSITIHGEIAPELDQLLRTSYLPRAVWKCVPGDGFVVVCEGSRCLPPVRTAEEFRLSS